MDLCSVNYSGSDGQKYSGDLVDMLSCSYPLPNPFFSRKSRPTCVAHPLRMSGVDVRPYDPCLPVEIGATLLLGD